MIRQFSIDTTSKLFSFVTLFNQLYKLLIVLYAGYLKKVEVLKSVLKFAYENLITVWLLTQVLPLESENSSK